MADKMKKQQAQEAAKREAAKKRAADAKDAAPKVTTRKSLRTNAAEDDPAKHEVKKSKVKTKDIPTKNASKKGAISHYFQKEAINLEAEAPSVQEALAEAADEYEEKPEGLGAQELVGTEQPELVTGGKMRQYQLEGLEWLKSLWMNGLCGILADEMGLGKTVQAISMIAFFKEKNIGGPFLIAAPLSTLRNWIDEFKRWTPAINVVL